ncbi:MAG: TetR/AcrR family transcriptional regulator [Acidimicrobiales bacterium]
MAVSQKRDRRHERHEATRQEILDAAWDVVRAEGLAALTMRGLARRVGMEPQSLYTYFDSKHAVYDAMFAQGNEDLLARFEQAQWPNDPRQRLRLGAEIMLTFDAEDAARSQLLFQRTIPDFEPSPESYAIAERVLAFGVEHMRSAGLSEPTHVDLFTALVMGLSAQQQANEPGGDRWLQLLDEALEMFTAHVDRRAR